MTRLTNSTRSVPGRKSEALILAIAGYLMLWLTASTPSIGGYMTHLDSLVGAYRLFYVSAFVIAAVIEGIAILLATKGRLAAAVIIMAALLTTYYLFLNGRYYPGEAFIPQRFVEANHPYTIMVSGVDVPGAELWVNGIKIGVLPLRTTLGDFRDKVPQWTKPPADFDANLASIWDNGRLQTDMKYWSWFELPRPYSSQSHQPWPRTKPSGPDIYYARVRYGGEWAYSIEGSGWDCRSVGNGLARFSYTKLDARLPLREKRLHALLNQVRTRGYRVDEPWAKALDTFGNDGWLAVRKLAQTEPPMMQVFDALARRNEQLAQPLDATTASATFNRICTQADRHRWYRTDDLTGRAVELLAAQLPFDMLVSQARRSMVDSTYFQYTLWSFDGQPQFGTFQQEAGTLISVPESDNILMGVGSGGATLPPSAFVLAHALSNIAAEPSPRGQACRDMIAHRIVPELILHDGVFRGERFARVILGYGATPEVAEYFEQQFRKTKGSRLWENHLDGGSKSPNRWLFYLAILNSPEARRFRQLNPDALMELADALVGAPFTSSGSSPADRVSFLFENPQAALTYWPRFCRSVKKGAYIFGQLSASWQYLNRLGDFAMPAMYVDALVETQPGRSELQTAMPALVALPLAKQEQIMTALTERLAKGAIPLDRDFADEGTKALLDAAKRLLGWEREAMNSIHQDQQHADYDLRELLKEATPERVQRTGSYLTDGQPQSPLVEMLAEQTQPELRKLALVGIRHYATPARRQLLQRLTADPDPAVRQEAAAVAAELESLAKSDPGAFKS